MSTPTAVGSGLRAELAPPWPFRLPTRGGPDAVSRVRDGVLERFLHVDGSPVLIRAWERPRESTVRIAAMPAEPSWLAAGDAAVEARRRRRPSRGGSEPERGATPVGPRAGPAQLEQAIERARNALGIDDDYTEFYARFKRDRLLGPAIRRMPWLRARRCLWPWESLAWAVTEQLIEVERAHLIQRRIVARWGAAALPPDRDRPLRDVPSAAAISARAPAELVALDLAPKRALALVKVAREVASGRADLERPEADRRLLAISEIGPWTVQMLGRKGRGDPDALPAGDLAYLKLVPRLIGMDRRATVEEVEEFFAPYAPFRGWAGLFALVAGKRSSAAPKPLRYQPPRPELEAA
jgi:3-methyladenine DNA glycosylase/8-oxoguanine DNA glycosylase